MYTCQFVFPIAYNPADNIQHATTPDSRLSSAIMSIWQ